MRLLGFGLIGWGFRYDCCLIDCQFEVEMGESVLYFVQVFDLVGCKGCQSGSGCVVEVWVLECVWYFGYFVEKVFWWLLLYQYSIVFRLDCDKSCFVLGGFFFFWCFVW